MTEQELEGLRGEVDYEDMYHMRYKADVVSINDPNHVHVKGHDRGFNFEPELIFDIGANVGVFSAYCRRLYPDAKIIAVEPHPDNISKFKENINDPNIILIEKAIGNGNKIYRSLTAANGTGESYVSVGLGFNEATMIKSNMELAKVQSITIKELFDKYYDKSKKTVLKLDVEGAENMIFEDEDSINLLKQIDYLAFELHYYSVENQDEVNSVTAKVLKSFQDTHHCNDQRVYFYATKK